MKKYNKKLNIAEELLFLIAKSLDAYVGMLPYYWGREHRTSRLNYLKESYEKKHKRSFHKAMNDLKKRGYLKIPKNKTLNIISLTKKGRMKALRVMIKIEKCRPRKDGKMVMLMYDIPKKKENVRFYFKGVIESLGYVMLQKSVWVSKYDVFDTTREAIKECGLKPHTQIFLIEKIGK